MANVFLNTEDFSAAQYDGAVTTTVDTHPAPAFAGALAGLADTLADTSGAAQQARRQIRSGLSTAAGDWVFSVYIRKDSDTSRYIGIDCAFDTGGTAVEGGIVVSTANSTIVNMTALAPAASGSDDIDANWRRFWVRLTTTGNSRAQMLIFPALNSIQDGNGDSAATGSVIAWGINLTQGTSLQAYEPDPSYTLGVVLTNPIRTKMHVIRY